MIDPPAAQALPGQRPSAAHPSSARAPQPAPASKSPRMEPAAFPVRPRGLIEILQPRREVIWFHTGRCHQPGPDQPVVERRFGMMSATVGPAAGRVSPPADAAALRLRRRRERFQR